MDAAESSSRKKEQRKPDDGEWYRMAHVLTKALYSTKELRPHLALLLYVVHNTWGAMGKRSFIFSPSAAARATGLARPNVIRARNLLVQANVLLKFDKEGIELGVNKYPESWDLSILNSRPPVSGGDTPLYPTDTPPVSVRYTPCIPQIQARGLESANDGHPGDPIDSNIDTIDITTTTERFANHFEVLRSVKGYPFDHEDDREMLTKLERMYPNVDILKELTSWSIWMLDNPIKKGDKPRGRIQNWMRKASTPYQGKQQSRPTQGRQQVSDRLSLWANEE